LGLHKKKRPGSGKVLKNERRRFSTPPDEFPSILLDFFPRTKRLGSSWEGVDPAQKTNVSKLMQLHLRLFPEQVFNFATPKKERASWTFPLREAVQPARESLESAAGVLAFAYTEDE